MPTYNYKCPACGREFDAYRHISERATSQCICGRLARKVFVPTRHFQLYDCQVYPLTHDHIDGKMTTWNNAKEYKDYIKRYNDTQIAMGQPQRTVLCPALE